MRRPGLPVLLAGAAFALGLLRVGGAFTDDSYIHLVFARAIAAGAGPCFNPGEAVYGFTSPLWALLLALFGGTRADAGTAHALALAFTLLAVQSTYALARAAGATRGGAWLAAATLGLHAWFLRWSMSGMETSLAAFLAARGMERCLRGGAAAGAGLILLSLGALARPELTLLWALALGVSTWNALRPGRAHSLAMVGVGVLGSVLVLGGWEAWIHSWTGAWLPTTFTAKRGHEALSFASLLNPTRHFFAVVLATDALLVLLAAVLSFSPRIPRPGRTRVAVLLAWPTLLAALYLLTRFQMISRYWVPALPALCAGVAVLSSTRQSARWVPAAWALFFAQQLVMFHLWGAPQMLAFTRGLERGPASMGEWLRQHAAPGSVVAAPDIGAIRFHSGLKILDLGGLVTPAMVPLTSYYELSDVVRQRRFLEVGPADYLLDRDPVARALAGDGYEALLDARMDNLGLGRPRPVFYTLYRLLPAGGR